MIQRIQSLYLLAVFISGILFYTGNISTVYMEKTVDHLNLQLYKLDISGIYGINGTAASGVMESHYFFGFPVIIQLLSLVTIFMFKNRKHQILMCRLTILATVILFGLINFFLFKMTDLSGSGGHISFSMAYFTAPLQVLLLYMSVRSIKKDDNLIRSTYRLR